VTVLPARAFPLVVREVVVDVEAIVSISAMDVLAA